MTQPAKYQGTTVTAFVTQYAGLFVVFGLFLGLTLYAAHTAPTLPARVVELFAFCVTFIVWLALLFQAVRARPWTALLELLALALCAGGLALVGAWVVARWHWRGTTLPLLLYLLLFLIIDEAGLRRRPRVATKPLYQVGLRLLCLLAAALLAVLLNRP